MTAFEVGPRNMLRAGKAQLIAWRDPCIAWAVQSRSIRATLRLDGCWRLEKTAWSVGSDANCQRFYSPNSGWS